MSATAKVMVKLANVSMVLEAAAFLYGLGLLDKPPNEYVKAYVLANPDINEALARASPSEERVPRQWPYDILAHIAGVPCRFCMGPGNSEGSCPQCGKPGDASGERSTEGKK